jgi:hypothetical protein
MGLDVGGVRINVRRVETVSDMMPLVASHFCRAENHMYWLIL